MTAFCDNVLSLLALASCMDAFSTVRYFYLTVAEEINTKTCLPNKHGVWHWSMKQPQNLYYIIIIQDSTIFALRMSMKEHEREINKLKSTLKLQQRSFKQSDEVVRALKEGLLHQEIWRQLSSNNTSHNNAAHVAFLEVSCCSELLYENKYSPFFTQAYFSQYNTKRQNRIHPSHSKDSSMTCVPLPPVPKMGLLALPLPEDNSR